MSDKLQEIKRDIEQKEKTIVATTVPSIAKFISDTKWLISQLEQAQAENDELKKRLENCMESHTRLELDKKKLQAVYNENYAKAIGRSAEIERLKADNQQLVEALGLYADEDNWEPHSFHEPPRAIDSGERARQALASVNKE